METLNQLSAWLYKIFAGWIAVASLIVFLLFTAFILPDQADAAETISGEVGSPDMSFFYTADKLYEMAEAYEEQGRAAYIRARFTFDLIWPLVYMLFLSTMISWLLKRVHLSENRWRWANLAPLLGTTFDYAENISTSLVMYRYPESTDILAMFAPIFTAIKWILVAGSFVLLSIGIITLIWQSIQKRLGE
jgi:hypothetical protein